MAYRDEVIADAPLAYWRLGEASGTTAADEQGAHNGTYVNTPTLGVSGAVPGDTAVSFARASSERMLATTLGTLGANLLTSSWEFWIKTTDTATAAAFGTFNTGTSMAVQVLLNRSSADALLAGSTMFYIRGSDGKQTRGAISTNIYDGQWHHVVMVVASATTFDVYVDGVAQSITYNNNTTPVTFANFGFALTVGARNLRGTVDNFVDATIDEFAVYASRLTSTRVQAHYAAASGTVYDLAGTIAGSGSLSGDVAADVSMAGSIAGAGTLSAELQIVRELAGAVAGAAVLTGDLQRVLDLGGAINGVAVLTGDVQLVRELAGTIAGAAVLTGDVQRVLELAGLVAGAGALTGNLQKVLELAGVIAGAGVLSGDLQIVGAAVVHDLAGTIAGAAVLSGDLQAILALEGSIEGGGVLEGALAVDAALEGLLAGSGLLSGSLSRVPVVVVPVVESPVFDVGCVVDVVPLTSANAESWAHEREVRRPRQLTRRVAVRPAQAPVASAVAGGDGVARFTGLPDGRYWIIGEERGVVRRVVRSVP